MMCTTVSFDFLCVQPTYVCDHAEKNDGPSTDLVAHPMRAGDVRHRTNNKTNTRLADGDAANALKRTSPRNAT